MPSLLAEFLQCFGFAAFVANAAAGRPAPAPRAPPLWLWCAPIRIGCSSAMEDMKVSLESLYTNKVKEIDYEGEEHYQE